MQVTPTPILLWLAAASAAVACSAALAAAVTPECLVPAKPGGGMDVTCKLLQYSLQNSAADNRSKSKPDAPLRISYLPGGIGAVAWNSIISQRRAEPDTLVAFSGGSLLNLAQGKYGKVAVGDVRWVAAVGADYGMIAVRSDAPFHTLRELMAAIKRDPAQVTIGVSGTVGSQDWLKMAILAKQAGIEPKALRFVALEGGGESFTALLANHVQVVSGDVSEVRQHGIDGKIRVLAVLSDARLPDPLATVPTAHEQGFDVTWPIIRGVYMGPQVADADYQKWVKRFEQLMATPAFERQRALSGLYPFAMTGANLTEYIQKSVNHYARQAREWNLIR